MKQTVLAAFIFFAFSAIAQTVPQKLNYQAVARNTSGTILANQAIAVKADILDADQTTSLYSETHTVTTNQFGLFTLQVGGGTVVSGNFSTINWGSGNKFIRTSADLTGGTSYQLMGVSQLLSVPYALYAGSVTNNNSTTPSDYTSKGLPVSPTVGAEKLRRWKEWKRSKDYRYDWLLIGDSYTHGFYSPHLRKFMLQDGLPNGGAGWCSFGRWGSIPESYNSSINNEDLHFAYTPSHWDVTVSNTIGLNGNVTNNVANTTIQVQVKELVDNVTLAFEKRINGGSFRYRINNDAYTTISCIDTIQSLGNLIIQTTNRTSSFTIDIEALTVGVTFMGCVARKNGNVVNFHKIGISGGVAEAFARNQMWTDNAKLVTPKGAIIMFGTNEKQRNTTPSDYKKNILNIITKLKSIDPFCDILLVSPTYTKFETEIPTTYSLDEYAKVLFELSKEHNCGFINLATLFGPFGQYQIDAGFMNNDRVHPSVVRGSKLIAQVMVDYLK